MSEALTTIRLSGQLGNKFGRVHKFVVDSAAGAVNALCKMIPGFESELMNSKDKGIGYAVWLGKENIGKDSLQNPHGGKDVRIAPIVMGSKKSGFLQIIIGIILIVVSFIPGFQALAPLGYSMVVGGVVQLLSPQPKALRGGDEVDNGVSYNFNGAVNTSVQGNPVPLLYGEAIVGSAVISGGIYSEDKN